MKQHLKEFCEKLKEYGLGDFEIKPKYERNYYDPACNIIPGYYIDCSGHLRSRSNPRIRYYKVYNKCSGEHITDFFYSANFVKYLLNEQKVLKQDKEKYKEAWDYFWLNRFS